MAHLRACFIINVKSRGCIVWGEFCFEPKEHSELCDKSLPDQWNLENEAVSHWADLIVWRRSLASQMTDEHKQRCQWMAEQRIKKCGLSHLFDAFWLSLQSLSTLSSISASQKSNKNLRPHSQVSWEGRLRAKSENRPKYATGQHIFLQKLLFLKNWIAMKKNLLTSAQKKWLKKYFKSNNIHLKISNL